MQSNFLHFVLVGWFTEYIDVMSIQTLPFLGSKNTNSETQQPGLESSPLSRCVSFAVYLMALHLCVLVCKVGAMISVTRSVVRALRDFS